MRISTRRAPAGTGNRLLDLLICERPSLRMSCEPVTMPRGTELYGERRPATHLWFPSAGVVSVVLGLANGCTSTVMTVGNEGFVGIPAWLGMPHTLERAVQQHGGTSFRVASRDVQRAAASHRPVRDLLQHFIGYALRFEAQTAVCNACHSVEQRVCRWLLVAADRIEGALVEISQAMLADFIGVRRQTIGEVAVRLQREGVIAYSRSDIRIIDRPALERRSCECYRTLLEVYRSTVEPRLR